MNRVLIERVQIPVEDIIACLALNPEQVVQRHDELQADGWRLQGGVHTSDPRVVRAELGNQLAFRAARENFERGDLIVDAYYLRLDLSDTPGSRLRIARGVGLWLRPCAMELANAS